MNRIYISFVLLFSIPLAAMDSVPGASSWAAYLKNSAASFSLNQATSELAGYMVPKMQSAATTVLIKATPVASFAWAHKGKIALGVGAVTCVAAGTLWVKGYYDTQLNKLREDMNKGHAGLSRQISGVDDKVSALAADVTEVKNDVKVIQKNQQAHTILLSALATGIHNLSEGMNAVSSIQGKHTDQLTRIEGSINAGFQTVNGKLETLAGAAFGRPVLKGFTSVPYDESWLKTPHSGLITASDID